MDSKIAPAGSFEASTRSSTWRCHCRGQTPKKIPKRQSGRGELALGPEGASDLTLASFVGKNELVANSFSVVSLCVLRVGHPGGA